MKKKKKQPNPKKQKTEKQKMPANQGLEIAQLNLNVNHTIYRLVYTSLKQF